MNETVEYMGTEHEVSLRGRCAHAHLPCKDRVEGPVPSVPPEDFTVILGAVMAGRTMEGLRAEMAALGGVERAVSLLLTWFEWVEAEVRGFPDLVEELHRLRGQVMAVGTVMAGAR